ncbi:PaaI family thioesterase [Aliikangiella sp. IMCC44653]
MTKAEQLLAKDPASQLLGIKLAFIDEGRCELTMLVTDQMVNGYGFCHGGFIYTFADTASAFASALEGAQVLTANNQIEYLRPAKVNETLTARASVSAVSGRNVFCDVQVTNAEQELVVILKSKLISQTT